MLQLFSPIPGRLELSLLELQLALRQFELAAMRRELQEVQARYLREVGGLYGEWLRLQRAVEDEEIRAGIRPPRVDDSAPDETEDSTDDAPDDPLCSREAPSADLKRIFRQIARLAHPDLAPNATARYRRHSIMAEANRAYAERDEDRLRLIMRSWHRGADPLMLDERADPDAIRIRVIEALALLKQLEAEEADLRASAIGKLKLRVDKSRGQGWDLFAEMVAQVQSDIARETAKLMRLSRHPVSHRT